MTHNGTCKNKKEKLHSVEWEYNDPDWNDDYNSITFTGKCVNCDTQFQKTYSNPLLSIVSKSTGEITNFSHTVDHLN